MRSLWSDAGSNGSIGRSWSKLILISLAEFLEITPLASDISARVEDNDSLVYGCVRGILNNNPHDPANKIGQKEIDC